jgi:hypothetical protein
MNFLIKMARNSLSKQPFTFLIYVQQEGIALSLVNLLYVNAVCMVRQVTNGRSCKLDLFSKAGK